MGYTTNAPTARVTRQVAITSVDVVGHGATGTGDHGDYYVDTSYYVGAAQVTPALGEQWVIQNINGQWRLDHRIPFNDPNQAAVVPTSGQHVIGSGQGPVEVNAGPNSTVNVNSPLSVVAYTTANRPAANSVPPGTHIWDSTLGKPIWSNGADWTDATGTAV